VCRGGPVPLLSSVHAIAKETSDKCFEELTERTPFRFRVSPFRSSFLEIWDEAGNAIDRSPVLQQTSQFRPLIGSVNENIAATTNAAARLFSIALRATRVDRIDPRSPHPLRCDRIMKRACMKRSDGIT